MGHHKDNEERRSERQDHDEHRQEIRDEVFEETGGGVDDLGSPDERRHQGDEDH